LGKPRILMLIVLILAVAGAYIAMAESEYFRNCRLKILDGVHRTLMNELSMVSTIPHGSDTSSRKSKTMIYVLGSTQERLKYHFHTAAALYEEVGARIYFLSRPGYTEYSSKLLRNLTNDEWSVRELGSLGVPADDVEAVPVPSGFFGTFSEGARISRFAHERGYKHLILVSSAYHAKRVHLAFSHFLRGGMDIYVCGANDPASLATLLLEYVKIVWYRWVLIPWNSASFGARKGIPGSRSVISHALNAENNPD